MRHRITLDVDFDKTRLTALTNGFPSDDPYHLFHLLTGQMESQGTVEKRIAAGITVVKNLPIMEYP